MAPAVSCGRSLPGMKGGAVRRRHCRRHRGGPGRRGPIETTGALVEIIRGALPAAALREKQHPAKRAFRASGSRSATG
ncbi:MAG: hypothetical protein ACLR1T_10045 [Evtepia gabavorous]